MHDRMSFAQFLNNAARDDPCSTDSAKGNVHYEAWRAYCDSGNMLPLPRVQRPPSPPETWHIHAEDFMGFAWWVNLQKAQVYINDTIVTDKKGNTHPGTYIALWLGRAEHSIDLWDEYLRVEGKPHNDYPQLQENHDSLLYRDPISFKKFRRALNQDQKLVLRTSCKGTHVTLAYAGVMSDHWQEESRDMMTKTLKDLIQHRFDEPEEKVHRFLNIKRHLIRRYCPASGLTIHELKKCTIMNYEKVLADLRDGNIDTSLYSRPQSDGTDTDYQREGFFKWFQRALERNRLAWCASIDLAEQDWVDEKRESGDLRYTWSPFQYRDPSSWSIHGSEVWWMALV